MFLGLLDQDPFVIGTDPDPDLDSLIIKQKEGTVVRKTLIPTVL
jgi:hypothetical protein